MAILQTTAAASAAKPASGGKKAIRHGFNPTPFVSVKACSYPNYRDWEMGSGGTRLYSKALPVDEGASVALSSSSKVV